MRVTYQHGNTRALSYPATVVDVAGDVADLLVHTGVSGDIEQFGVRVIDRCMGGDPNTCWV